LACYPVSSILLHMKYFKMRRVSKGTEIEKYQMNKTMREANASMMINNFTSLLVIVFTLHTTVTGSITEENPALLSMVSVVTVLHLLKLLGNNLKNQSLLGSFSAVGSLVLKMGSLLSLLSSDSNPAYLVLVSSSLFLLSIAVNWWTEKRLITGESANDEKKTFLRAAHSLVFPLPLERQDKQQALGLSLQLLVGNVAAAIMGFSMPLLVGVINETVITQNLIKSFFVQAVFLIAYSTLTHLRLSLLTSSSEEPLSVDDFEEDIEDASESTPLIGNQNQAPTEDSNLKKVGYAMVLMFFLLLILACSLPLLTYVFNTCSPFQSSPNSQIRCDTTPQTYGSTCWLTCSPMFRSEQEMVSSCQLGGAWTVRDLSCRPQVAAVIGKGWNKTKGEWVQATDIYPPTGRSSLPGLSLAYGVAGYVDGRILYCGGENIQDASLTPVKTCHSLQDQGSGWLEEPFTLLQEVLFASSAVVEDGQALLVLGGRDAQRHPLSSTQLVRPGHPTQPGPGLTGGVSGQCSVSVEGGDKILMTGGGRPGGASARAEVLDYAQSSWHSIASMNQARMQHSCAQVWLSPDDSNILSGLVGNSSVLSAVVAGGVFLDKAGAFQDVLSVEVYLPWNNTWLELPTLPTTTLADGSVLNMTFTQIFSLTMGSAGGSTLCLLGGEHADLDRDVGTFTPHVWRLSYHSGNHTYYWDHDTAITPYMDMAMEVQGSPLVGVPDTFYAP